MNNFKKYLKYKHKYLNLKNKIKAGATKNESNLIKDSLRQSPILFNFSDCKDIINTLEVLENDNPQEILKLADEFNFYKKNYTNDPSFNLKRFKIDCYATNLKMIKNYVLLNKKLYKFGRYYDIRILGDNINNIFALNDSTIIFRNNSIERFSDIPETYENLEISTNEKNFSNFFERYYYIDNSNNLICNNVGIISVTNELRLENTFKKISGGHNHVVFLDNNNDMYVLGNNFYGQLGLKLEEIDESDYDYLYFTLNKDVFNFGSAIFENEINDISSFKISRQEIIANKELLSQNYKIVFVSKPIKSRSNVVSIFTGNKITIYQDFNEKIFGLGNIVSPEVLINFQLIENKIKKIYFQQNGGYAAILDYTGKLYFIGAALYLTEIKDSKLDSYLIIDFSVIEEELYQEIRVLTLLITTGINKFRKKKVTFAPNYREITIS